MHENSGPLQALTWHSLREQSWDPCWPPSVFKSKNSLGRVWTGCSFLRWAMRGLLHAPSMSEALNLSPGCPVSTSLLPSLRVLRGRQTHSCSLCFVFLKQDLDQVQLHLEEVRFFDVFGFSEAAGAWQCFMCNNPERATGESPPPSPGYSESRVPLGLQGCRNPTTLVGFLLA